MPARHRRSTNKIRCSNDNFSNGNRPCAQSLKTRTLLLAEKPMLEIVDYIKSNTYLIGLSILVGAVIAALIVDFVTTRILMRLAGKTETMLDDEIISALRRPLFFSVFFIGISLALGQAAPDLKFLSTANKILISLAILLWTVAAMRISKSVLRAMAQSLDKNRLIRPRSLPVFEIFMKTLIFGGAAYGMLMAWHVDVTAWLASAGILGIAIGFAAKDTLANFFSGVFILADSPYKIGDYIILDSGERGKVTDIGIRSTRILTRDDIQIILPNAAIANAKIINETGGPHEKERVRIKVGVSYDSDIEKVRQVLMEVAANSQYLIEYPPARVRFRQFGDSALLFELLGWIEEPVLRGRAIDELNTAVLQRFRTEKITIPFPQRSVHLAGSEK